MSIAWRHENTRDAEILLKTGFEILQPLFLIFIHAILSFNRNCYGSHKKNPTALLFNHLFLTVREREPGLPCKMIAGDIGTSTRTECCLTAHNSNDLSCKFGNAAEIRPTSG